MKVFLSYASSNRVVAEQVSLALRELGYDVFFDRTSLAAGEGFHERIREQLVGSDLFVILVSRDTLRTDSYCLTEIEFAEQRWPHPTGRVLPVLIGGQGPRPPFLLRSPSAEQSPIWQKRRCHERFSRVAFVIWRCRSHRARGCCRWSRRSSRLSSRVDQAVHVAELGASSGSCGCASSGASDARLLLALADPPELAEISGRDEVRALAKLDAEPVALARDDELVAVATRSSTPIQLFRGEGFEPLPPLAIEFFCDDCAQRRDGLATRPIDLAVFDERV
jgi:hypothetical protein